MTTTSVKISELTGPALRYAVAVAAGYEISRCDGELAYLRQGARIRMPLFLFKPDRDWSQCGPLIERYQVQLVPTSGGWTADCLSGESHADIWVAETPLIAACRAIASSHWGEYADIPSELVQEQSDA